MRRHSIATGQHPHPHPILPPVAHGIKRKLSMERSVFAPVGEEPDSQLVGPGVPSVMEVDPEPPAPKRRGSAIDTQRIAQLSLNDRRGSTDSRGPSVPWWNERRDSVSNPSSSGYSYSGRDSPHGRLPTSIAAFSWPGSQSSDPSTPTPNGTEPNTPNIPRQFDASPSNTIPPLNYPPDRRMSVPDTLISPSGAYENFRSRSRPPSRQSHFAEPVTRANSVQDSANAAGQHPGFSLGKKDLSATPYSRSPELRVSHKLAERKRRKEMKDLFDELRDQLPADRGMKASKWEILTKAIDFVVNLKQSHQDMVREIDRLRQELDIARGGSGSISSFQPPNPHVVYGQNPIVSSQGSHLQPPLPGPSQLPLPRQSTQNTYPSITSSPPHPSPNGGFHRPDGTSP
ncbi:hypothetical protein AGABI1DRAFT_113482 [Agaricus bisporus var. burnettii JB137-S8]|uniref:BHLH domain-containing protein n=1 Tax=Agaricus bisporus var. burnettii (strain JB137-S8 / ATCC MYA-4627 / FGSC 10392) TaxID=597362 RepID=K5XY69_AGABU|nr:hypothetical protein AGABI2DRAFT_191870 [Agaricus bisporus var. bisporus H97]XP_007329470.1 uncharacterized protein AGABI1DRAFT_113482 [Agaricus bisporus var. burnettii JB137-S8]EKM80280.1 hypothetical protein AGABI1DRAFT_113482 [Agaricus bisporus var. burnettii JB137-S8]EKV48240.1 hypothetical protein AGABI2DRAFT_191870 [Agaricus bisporus var. bisporus H97]